MLVEPERWLPSVLTPMPAPMVFVEQVTDGSVALKARPFSAELISKDAFYPQVGAMEYHGEHGTAHTEILFLPTSRRSTPHFGREPTYRVFPNHDFWTRNAPVAAVVA